MKHATEPTLIELEPLLARIRKIEGIQEKKLGIFYRKSKAFLHFHEHGKEIFADVRLKGTDFDRLPCTTRQQRQDLIAAIQMVVAERTNS